MIRIDGNNLTLSDFVKVARFKEKIELTEESKILIHESRKMVDEIVDNGKVVYGITTGFGKLSDVFVKKEQVGDLQKNLLMSHACGVGKELSDEVVRGMMVLRVNALAKGVSGVRLETLEKLIELLNKNIIPVIFEKGSLGASGDLAPLAHMSLPLIGLGEVFYDNKRYPTMEIFNKLGIKPIEALGAKEGLSLINGTQAMTSIGGLTLYDALKLSKLSDIAVALTMEALNGITNAYDPRVHQVRGQIGQIETAKKVLEYLEGSENTTLQGELRVQDAYSIRCAPQVHGATKDALSFISDKVNIELNAATDNPVLFTDTFEAISAGNFHGQPMALPFDFMGIALSELANISERRLERMVNPQLSNGLPAFLVNNPGINSGFMIVQYSAASLVSENKVFAHPASVDSIPSSANQEDHVSMGTIGARKARGILDNAEKVIAMEIMTACQAIDLRKGGKLGKYTKKAYETVRKHIPFIENDEVMYNHLHKVDELIKSDLLYNAIFKED